MPRTGRPRARPGDWHPLPPALSLSYNVTFLAKVGNEHPPSRGARWEGTNEHSALPEEKLGGSAQQSRKQAQDTWVPKTTQVQTRGKLGLLLKARSVKCPGNCPDL